MSAFFMRFYTCFIFAAYKFSSVFVGFKNGTSMCFLF